MLEYWLLVETWDCRRVYILWYNYKTCSQLFIGFYTAPLITTKPCKSKINWTSSKIQYWSIYNLINCHLNVLRYPYCILLLFFRIMYLFNNTNIICFKLSYIISCYCPTRWRKKSPTPLLYLDAKFTIRISFLEFWKIKHELLFI